ncbi:SLC13 family permease [Tepidicaulis sp. LMO-SS28]|uniref:SLC13 family permease n=1 Tax=Tepidicaulis sp. LMO-SS28 TaxID=3447455 RepID=UPI003EE35737
MQTEGDTQEKSTNAVKLTGLVLGPLAAAALFLSPLPEGLSPAAWATAAVAVWMAVWWVTEAVPLAATALLPLVLFPLLGITDIAVTAAPYANPVIFLFLGGFWLALAMERSGLHKRVALSIIARAGGHPRRLIGAVMAAAALLSMWVSNTATTMMLLPIAASLAGAPKDPKEATDPARRAFATALMLGVAYAASIGGLATPVGSPPNALAVGYLAQTHGIHLSFADWMMFGVPVVLVLLPLSWLVLTRLAFKVPADAQASTGQSSEIAEQRTALGPMTRAEKRVGLVMGLVALFWIGHPWLAPFTGLTGLTDAGIAMTGALLLFALPDGGEKGERLLDWNWAKRAPWDVLLLFGGGLSLAQAVETTELAQWLGAQLEIVKVVGPLALVLAAVVLIIFLTELTSNTATASAFLPVAGALAMAAALPPASLTVPVALAASCAFMLPVATPPNAIIFGSGHVTMATMMRAGLRLNILAIIVLSAAAFFIF